MATANELYNVIGASLGLSPTAIEPYGAGLRKGGQWGATKPGRGATPIPIGGAASLLVALLIGQPTMMTQTAHGLASLFLTYANARPATIDDEIQNALGDRLGLKRESEFHDWIRVILSKIIDGTIGEIFLSPRRDSSAFEQGPCEGAHIVIGVEGPHPITNIEFRLSDSFIDELVSQGLERVDLDKLHIISFRHFIYGWAREVEAESGNADHYSEVIESIWWSTRKGIQFRRAIGSEVLQAVASLYPNTS